MLLGKKPWIWTYLTNGLINELYRKPIFFNSSENSDKQFVGEHVCYMCHVCTTHINMHIIYNTYMSLTIHVHTQKQGTFFSEPIRNPLLCSSLYLHPFGRCTPLLSTVFTPRMLQCDIPHLFALWLPIAPHSTETPNFSSLYFASQASPIQDDI